MAATTTFTIEDFERLPSEMAKNRELVDGELIDVSGYTPIHNLLRDDLGFLMKRSTKEQNSGTVIWGRDTISWERSWPRCHLLWQ
jgi:hypothetical protein